jgi:hypothetical protein
VTKDPGPGHGLGEPVGHGPAADPILRSATKERGGDPPAAMNRREFGPWGLGLGADEFARALAALGVSMARWPDGDAAAILERLRDPESLLPSGPERGPDPWDLSPLMSGGPEPWADPTRVPPAVALAAAWQQAVAMLPVEPWLQIEIRPMVERFDLAWVADQLMAPSVRARSVYVRLDATARVDWQWPLRVAFLESDPASRVRSEFAAESVRSPWLGPLVDVMPAGHIPCDLLVVPTGLRDGTPHLLRARMGLRANCLLFLRGLDEPWERVPAFLAAIRSVVDTGGVAFARVGPHQDVDRLKGLVAELSHNRTFGAALQWPREDTGFRRPVLFAQPDLLIEETVDKVRGELERVVTAASAEPPERPRTRSLRGIEPTTGAAPPEEAIRPEERRALADRLGADLSYTQETGGATAVSDIARRAAPLRLAGAHAEIRSPRFVGARVFDLTDPTSPRRLFAGLRAAAAHAVDVFIGPREHGGLTADRPFPEAELPPSPSGHSLTVVFSEPVVAPDAQVGTLFLPPEGVSAPCRFFFRLPQGVDRIEARISVLYRNRILQTALLRAAAVADPDRRDAVSSLAVTVEAVVRPALSGLDARRPFDAALVLNHATDGSPQLTAMSGDRAELISFTPGMDAEVHWFSDKLSHIALDPEGYDSLTADGTVRLLRTLAQHGHLLYDAIVTDWSLGERITGARRIQLVATRPDAFVPLEFVYERASPRDDAPLCPGAAEALEAGRCPSTCPPDGDQKGVVCPIAFWCLNRVIERHAHDPRVRLDGHDFGLQTEPASGRASLSPYVRALLGASSRVDGVIPGGVAAVEQTLDEVTRHRVSEAAAWDDWATEVRAGSPSLMVLLVHHDIASNDLPEIEIGEEKFLSVADLDRQYVLGPSRDRRPVVLLIGCKTAREEQVDFHSFVAGFRRNGAAAVIGTLATILGRHATPVTQGLIKALEELMGASSSANGLVLGDALLVVRRRLLAAGVPMALCLVAYGDADWQLQASEP